MDINLAVMLRESARRVPGKPAMVLGETTISYAELDALSDRVDANLAAEGLTAGDAWGFDSAGFLFIVDRIKDLIIRGGYNVYPREVEEVIYAHPAVAEAAVIGVPDTRLGDEVHAVVAVKPEWTVTETELIEFVRQKLAAYKYPRTVEFRDALPKGPSGKVLKKELRPL
jgi:acyl-CoA synthetase (AMP-forming)/AMP-acid ligase II